LIGSKRNKSDGCTIIGSQEPNKSGEVFNDFVIPSTDVGIGKRHLIIKYNMDNKSYYLRDLGDGSGTFVRLDVPLVRYALQILKSIVVTQKLFSYRF
jgi:pSer/pThr/pTyr-binding forkhead associated (FHA) protein